MADLSSHSSSDSAKYQRAWLKGKVTRSYILSAGQFPDTCSRELYIALNHKEISSIMVGDRRTLREKRKKFVISNIVSIVSSTSKKSEQKRSSCNQGFTSMKYARSVSSKNKASTKREHFIAQVRNTEVKWSIKPCIVQKKLARH